MRGFLYFGSGRSVGTGREGSHPDGCIQNSRDVICPIDRENHTMHHVTAPDRAPATRAEYASKLWPL